MEGLPTTIPLLLLRNIITSFFIHADKFLLNLGKRYRILNSLRYILVSTFFFLLQFFPSHENSKNNRDTNKKIPVVGNYPGDTGISRALAQLLWTMNDVPVSSRKYEVVRTLSEKVVNDNLSECHARLDEINVVVLSAAFSRTLLQLENRVAIVEDDSVHEIIEGSKGNFNKLSRVTRAVWYCFEAAWSRMGMSEVNRCGKSAEKLAAEVLWLAQKLAQCGNVEEAVERWGSANKLAWLALSAEPRLQCSLVKVSVFLLKQAKETGNDKEDDEGNRECQKQTKIKLLMSWLPLLCRATNGTDTPLLSFSEKAEVEKALEEIIEALSTEEQEQILALWLHHYVHCPTSDWPNLQDCYSRWCNSSRRLLILQ
ncbi:Indole-3-glycerol phosphate synthase [Heracleum sosnowskyi]|uniref:Indole-3-glycerol phosphate synthase n=1 Tax=Heracleum sosnowskyi TaxID=360622 RepID=A0AAD8IJD0_9APIA|nr:Indole-3-glycerol phosphate synthase [Heracleum sosnowskyi]